MKNFRIYQKVSTPNGEGRYNGCFMKPDSTGEWILVAHEFKNQDAEHPNFDDQYEITQYTNNEQTVCAYPVVLVVPIEETITKVRPGAFFNECKRFPENIDCTSRR